MLSLYGHLTSIFRPTDRIAPQNKGYRSTQIFSVIFRNRVPTLRKPQKNSIAGDAHSNLINKNKNSAKKLFLKLFLQQFLKKLHIFEHLSNSTSAIEARKSILIHSGFLN